MTNEPIQAFDGRQCNSDWSSCNQLPECECAGELLPDPWNKHNYFMCVNKIGFLHKFFVFRRSCPDGYEFDAKALQCVKTIVVVVQPCTKPSCKPAKPAKPPCTHGCSSHG